MDDSVLSVRQIGSYPQETAAGLLDALLVQPGGVGSPYARINAPDLVSTALFNGGAPGAPPFKLLAAGPGIVWSGFEGASTALSPPVSLTFSEPTGFVFSGAVTAPAFVADEVLIGANEDPAATQKFVTDLFAATPIVNTFNFRTGNVQLTTDDILRAGAAPTTNAHFNGDCTAPTVWNPSSATDSIATTAFVQQAICNWYFLATAAGSIVRSFNGRGGDIVLNADDITIGATVPGQYALANTAPIGDASKRIANTSFVDTSMAILGEELERDLARDFGDAPADGKLYGRENAAWAVVPAAAAGGTVFSIVNFGGVGDGVTDNLAAYNAAIAAIRATPSGGGTIYFPQGTWYSSAGYDVPSNISIQGAGMTATTMIGNPAAVSPSSYTMIVFATFTGTGNKGYNSPITYNINAPTIGTNTVTTTSAADAGNFNAGDVIFISGGLHGTNFWYPSWTTTVVSSSASTGVITLSEIIPIAGSVFSLVQKILVYPQNVRISDLNISAPVGAAIGGFQAGVARNVIIERVANTSMSATRHPYLSFSAVRDGYVSNCTMSAQGAVMDALGCFNTTYANNTVNKGYIQIDGGTFNSTFINNVFTDSMLDNGTATSAISIVSDSQYNRIIGNLVQNSASSVGAIYMGAGNDAGQGNNIVIGNTINGINTVNTTGIAVNGSANNTFVGNTLNNFTTGFRFTANSTGQVVSGNQFNNVTTQVVPDATSGVIPAGSDAWVQLPAGTTSANAAVGSLFATVNSSATNFTGFTGGVPGQQISLWIQDANTTLVNSTTFNLLQISNYTPPLNTMVRFIYHSGNWREISRSPNINNNAQFPRGLTIGPASGGLTISSIAAPAAAKKGFLGIDTNNLVYYEPQLVTAAPQSISGTSGTITSSSATIAASGTCTLTLPAAASIGTWLYLVSTNPQIVQSAAANVVPLAGGAAAAAIFPASAPHWVTLQYNGTNWVTFASA